MRITIRVAFLALALLTGCVRQSPRERFIGGHDERDRPPEPPPKKSDKPPPIPIDTVPNAALPFLGARISDCSEMAPESVIDALSKADVVCIGEEHANPHSHWAELRVLDGLVERRAMNGREIAVGIEMLPRKTQALLDKWSQGKIGESDLLEQAQWEKNWGYDFGYYRPQLELGRQQGLSILALNAPHDLAHEVATNGVTSLSDDKLKLLPELDMSDNEHKAWFRKAMQDHPGSKSNFENRYAAQVIWDETMADSAARWLSGHLPSRQLVIFAGFGHCRKNAIPKRIRRRISAKIVSVLPTVGLETKAACDRANSFDFAFMMKSEE